jgi:hypothetical protein
MIIRLSKKLYDRLSDMLKDVLHGIGAVHGCGLMLVKPV